MGNRQSVELLLDGGGPMLIWQEASGSLNRRLLILTSICDNPECDCRDISVQGMLFDNRYRNVEYRDHLLSYSFKPREGESLEPPPLRQLSAAVDIDTGEARFNTFASEEMCDEEMLGWLKEGMSEYNLEKLRKRWRLAKGIDQDQWKNGDWSWWRAGDMVSWLEVFPDEINIIFLLKEDAYWVDDMYCINPGCPCKEVGLCFHRITTGEVEHLGAISVTLPSGKYSGVMGEQGNEREVKPLWNELRKRPGILSLLKERMGRIKPIGQEIVRLSQCGKELLGAPSPGKVGRNAPCPCGSGKKAKKCCLS